MAIDLDDLPTTVRKLWEAIVPPVLHFIVAAAGFVYVTGVERSFPNLATIVRLPSDAAQKALEFYGIAAFIPVVVALAALLIANASVEGLRWLGLRIPPFLTQDTTFQFRAAVDDWTLRRLWVRHPEYDNIGGINLLHSLAVNAEEQALADATSYFRMRSLTWHRRKVGWHEDEIRFAKGLLAVLTLSWLCGRLIGAGTVAYRWWIVTGAILAWIFFNTARLIKTEHEYCSYRISAYLDTEEALLGKKLEPTNDTFARDSERIKHVDHLLRDGQVWTLRFAHGSGGVHPVRQILTAFWAAALRVGGYLRRVFTSPPRPHAG